MPSTNLTADYSSPTESKKFSATLHDSQAQDSQAQDVKAKTSYLSALRSGASQMQAEINAHLTQKMDDEKAAGAQASSGNGAAQDQKLEEMYGEEDPEQDG